MNVRSRYPDARTVPFPARLKSLPTGLRLNGAVADIARIKPDVLPAGLHGNQLAAYLEGYAAADAWTFVGEAFEASSLRSQLQVSFIRGFDARRAEIAAKEQAG